MHSERRAKKMGSKVSIDHATSAERVQPANSKCQAVPQGQQALFGKYVKPDSVESIQLTDEELALCKRRKSYLTLNPDLKEDLERFKKDIFVRSGGHCVSMPLPKYIRNRELSVHRTAISRRECTCLYGHCAPSAFQPFELVYLTNKFIPNEKQWVTKVPTKTFCCQFTQDGRLLTASQDEKIRVYARGSRGKYTFQRAIDVPYTGWSILDMAISPDGRNVVYSTWSDCLYSCTLYKADDGDVSWTVIPSGDIDHTRFVTFAVRFSLDGAKLLAASCAGIITVVDAESRTLLHALHGHLDDVNALCCNPSSQHIFMTGSDDGMCKVWDMRLLSENGGSAVGVFAGHLDGIVYCDCRADGSYVLTNSKDQSIKVWDVRRFSSEGAQYEAEQTIRRNHWDYRHGECPAYCSAALPLKNDGSLITLRGHSVVHTLIRAKFSPARTGYRYVYTGSSNGGLYAYQLEHLVKFTSPST